MIIPETELLVLGWIIEKVKIGIIMRIIMQAVPAYLFLPVPFTGLDPPRSVHHFEFFGNLLETGIIIEIDLGFSWFSGFGGDQAHVGSFLAFCSHPIGHRGRGGKV